MKARNLVLLDFSIVQETGTHFFAMRPQRYECYIEPDDY